MWSANATNNFFILQNLITYFGPYGPSSGDNYRNDIQYVLFSKIPILPQYIHYIHDYEAIYYFHEFPWIFKNNTYWMSLR
jgi:hypothetical protein